MMPASLELPVFTNLASHCFFANMQIGSYTPWLMDCLSERAVAVSCVRFKGLLAVLAPCAAPCCPQPQAQHPEQHGKTQMHEVNKGRHARRECD